MSELIGVRIVSITITSLSIVKQLLFYLKFSFSRPRSLPHVGITKTDRPTVYVATGGGGDFLKR